MKGRRAVMWRAEQPERPGCALSLPGVGNRGGGRAGRFVRLMIPLVFGLVLTAVAISRGEDGLNLALAGHKTAERTDRRAEYEAHALTHQGNVQRGRELFFDRQQSQCVTCHQVDGQGGEVGPDLSRIGSKFDRPHLIESLLEPSRQIVEGYQASTVVMKDGRVVSGIIKNETPTSLTLFDANNESLVIDHSDIEMVRPMSLSLMPEGLSRFLDKNEFTDLIAYLETLRPQGKSRFGDGVTGPISLPEGVRVETVATGLTGATALETLPDGRVLVCEQTGTLRVVKNGELLDQPMLELDVESYWERGLIGVTVAPDFSELPYVYVCYVAKSPFTHHRVSRFRVDGDRAVAGSEQILLRGDDQSDFGGQVPAGHQGGGIHFGIDGKLYIGIGENTAKTPAQQLDTFQGKLLRINPDGSIPSDNPFMDRAEGKYRAIWAAGCRNPFTFAVQPSTGTMLINDVGGKYEEINPGRRGANYGWPVVDHGPTDRREFVSPIHAYPQASISGGDFAPEDYFDKRYAGRYFFADFVHGWIKTLDPVRPDDVTQWATGMRRPVDLRFGPDGSLYVLLRNAWVIDDKFQAGTGTLLRLGPDQKSDSTELAGALRPWKSNPWYWSRDGQPVLLLGGSDDDNLFQWPKEKLIRQLERIAGAGGNVIRNTMSDRKDRGFEVYPFLQRDDGRYDLRQWNEEYWRRFETMLRETSRRGIVVQIEVWDRFDYTDVRDHDPDRWEKHPYNPGQNVNYTYAESGLKRRYPEHPGRNKQPFFFTTPNQRHNKTLLPYQQRFVDKLLKHSLKYDHVLYCIDNETKAEPQWGEYWARWIKRRARQHGKQVMVTEMWDDWDLKAERHRQTFDRPQLYDYVDVSQNNHNSGQEHWDNFLYVRRYLSEQPRPMNTTKTYGADGNKFRHTDQDAIERFWRHLLAGAASIRFHRPDSGLGINDRAVACLRAARLLEELIPLWTVEPALDILDDRAANEAYAAASRGRDAIAFYFPAAAERPQVRLKKLPHRATLTWIHIDGGRVAQSETLEAGDQAIQPPSDGNYAAALVK